MAAPIRIEVILEPKEISATGDKIAKQLQSALDSGLSAVRATGKRVGDALSSGAEQSVKQTEEKIRLIRERGIQQRLAQEQRAEGQIAVLRQKALADAERDARRFAEASERAIRRAQPPDSLLAFFRRFSSTIREAGESIQQAGEATTRLLTRPLLDLGRAAVKSAVDIDRQVNVLKALTGSAAAAEERFKALVAISARSPGLTTSLAATLDAQLRTVNVSVATIDKILPAIGKLNAVAPLGDPAKFAGNLTQLITQGFERTDLKELVGQSPLAGELIKQIFGVDNPTNAKAIREAAAKAGIDTTEEFFAAFASAAANNSKLAGVTESLGTQFEKLSDRVLVALRPLGLAVIEALQPIVERAVPIIEKFSEGFRNLPQGAQQAIIVITALVAAIGPLLVAVGALIQTFGAAGNLITVISALFGTGGAFAGAAAALAGFAAAIPPVAIALGALAIVIGGLVVANELFGESVQEAAEASKQASEAGLQRVETGQKELDVLKNLREQSSLSIQNQQQIQEAYDALTPVQQERVRLYAEESGGIETTSGKLTGLIDLLEQENAVRRASLQKESIEQGVKLANQLTITTANLEANRLQVQRLEKEIAVLTTSQAEAENTGARFGRSLAGPGVSAAEVFRQKIAELSPELERSKIANINNQKELLSLATAFDAARKASGQTTEEFINNAIAAGGLGGNLDALRVKLVRLATLSEPEGPIVPADVVAKANADRDKRLQDEQNRRSKLASGAGGGGESGESKARQLREAQLRFTKETLEQQNRLIEDANQRELRAVEQRFKDEEITIREFYETKTGLEQANIGNAINLIQTELQAAKDAFDQTKPNTVERIRLQTEINRLTTDLELKTRALTDAEIENQNRFLEAANQKKLELLKQTQSLALPSGERTGELPTDQIARTLSPTEQDRQRKIKEANDLKREANLADIAAAKEELQIQQAIAAGTISEAEGKEATLAIQRELRDVLISSLEAQKALETDPEKLARLNLEIQKLASLGQQLTPAQAFFKGLRSQAETTAEAFERIGANLKDKFLGVLDSGIDKLTAKFGFFKDLIGDIIKSLTRKVISQLFGLGGTQGGGFLGGGGAPSGGGFNLGGLLGGLLGGGQQSGGGGGFNIANLFGQAQTRNPSLTGGFAGGNPAAAILNQTITPGGGTGGIQSLFQNLLSGGTFSAPASISLPGIGGTAGINPNIGQGGFGAAGAGLGQAGALAQLFKGIGFGKAPGSGGALAGLAPLLGVSLGSSLGSDTLTKILGGVAGGLLGVGLTAAPAIIGAGGALSGSLGFLAPLFSNPITVIAAAAALPAIFLLGRARQRGRDERSSGNFLQDAIDSIRELRKQVSSDQIDGTQARSTFNNEILATFIQQINTLKTKSVRESRLKNQVADLKKLFEDEVGPEIELQKTRAKRLVQLVPEFANSGVVPGIYRGVDDTLVRAHAGEMFLNRNHQQQIARIAGGDVFQRVGVPDAPSFDRGGTQTLQFGGTVQGGGQTAGPLVINVGEVRLMVSPDDATQILFIGARTDDGQEVIVNAGRAGRRSGL